MTKKSRGAIKKYFSLGKRPNQGNYFDLVDSFINLEETDLQTVKSDISASGLKVSGEITGSGTISSSKFQGVFEGALSSSAQIASEISGTLSTTSIAALGGGYYSSSLQSLGNITSSGTISSSGKITATSFVGDGSGLTGVTSTTTTINLLTASLATGSLIVSGNSTYTSGSATLTKAIETSGSILPMDSKQYDLGSPTLFFNNAFLENLTVEGSINISGSITPRYDDSASLGSSTNQYREGHISTASIGEIHSKLNRTTITVSGSLIPHADGAWDLGASNTEWDNIYIDKVARVNTLTGLLGTVQISASFIPSIHDTFNLGHSSKRFLNSATATASIGEIHGYSSSFTNSDGNHSVLVSGNLVPHGNKLQDLGMAGSDSSGTGGVGIDGTARQWRNLFLEGTASVNVIRGDSATAGTLFFTGSNFSPIWTSSLNYGNINQTNHTASHWYGPACTLGTSDRHWKKAFLTTGSMRFLTSDAKHNKSSYKNNLTDPVGGVPIILASASIVPETAVNASTNPTNKGVFTLGTFGRPWADIHTNYLEVGGYIYKETQTGDGLGSIVDISGSLWPVADALAGGSASGFDIGSYNREFHHVYAKSMSMDVLYNEFYNSYGEEINLSASLLPTDSGSFSLGSGPKEFSDIWVRRVNTQIIDASASVDISVIGNMHPYTDATYNLGSEDNEWNNVYVDGYLSVDKITNIDTSEFNIQSNVSPTTDNTYYLGRTKKDGGDRFRWQHIGAVSSSVLVLLGSASLKKAFGSNTSSADADYYKASPKALAGQSAPVIFCSGAYLPHTDFKYDLGSQYHQWRSLYIKNILISGGTFYPTDDSGSVDTTNVSFDFEGDLIPNGDNLYDLGSDANQWKAAHISSASIAHLKSKESTNKIFSSGSLTPHSDNNYDLGQTSLEWRNLYIDNKAHIDILGNEGDNIVIVTASLHPSDHQQWSLGNRGVEWKQLIVANITASMNISASGFLEVDEYIQTDSHITASGNITASGDSFVRSSSAHFVNCSVQGNHALGMVSLFSHVSGAENMSMISCSNIPTHDELMEMGTTGLNISGCFYRHTSAVDGSTGFEVRVFMG